MTQGVMIAAWLAWHEVANQNDAWVIVRRFPSLGTVRLIVSAYDHHAMCEIIAP